MVKLEKKNTCRKKSRKRKGEHKKPGYVPHCLDTGKKRGKGALTKIKKQCVVIPKWANG